MSRKAERDLLEIRVPCASYHIMRRKGATLLINMHVFRFSEFMNLAFATTFTALLGVQSRLKVYFSVCPILLRSLTNFYDCGRLSSRKISSELGNTFGTESSVITAKIDI